MIRGDQKTGSQCSRPWGWAGFCARLDAVLTLMSRYGRAVCRAVCANGLTGCVVPVAQLFFTDTHFNVYGSTMLGANTDSFPLSGDEEVKFKDVPGLAQPAKFSYQCELCSGGERIRTWTYQWDAGGENRLHATISDRRFENPLASSFHERVIFRRFNCIENSVLPDVEIQRYMLRDVSELRALRPLPPALVPRLWQQSSSTHLQPPPGEVTVVARADAGATLTATPRGVRGGHVRGAVAARALEAAPATRRTAIETAEGAECADSGSDNYTDTRTEIERVIDSSGCEPYESVGELGRAVAERLWSVWAEVIWARYAGLAVAGLMLFLGLVHQLLHGYIFGGAGYSTW